MCTTRKTRNPNQAADATVFLLGSENCIIATAVADRGGLATFPASYDSPRTKYLFAELSPLLVTGVRWPAGRREYNLPLRVEPLVNRAIVKRHNRSSNFALHWTSSRALPRRKCATISRAARSR